MIVPLWFYGAGVISPIIYEFLNIAIYPTGSSFTIDYTSTSATYEILANASPLNPIVFICIKSDNFSSLEV